jgi:hypothetical protein
VFWGRTMIRKPPLQGTFTCTYLKPLPVEHGTPTVRDCVSLRASFVLRKPMM